MSNFWTPSERGDGSANLSSMAVPLDAVQTFWGYSPIRIWSTQPSVRKVVDFIASNIASIPLHVYERTAEGRERVRDGQLADIIASPSKAREQTPYLFWKRVLIDWLMWERSAVHVDKADGELIRIPPAMWVPKVDQYGLIRDVRVMNAKGQQVDFDPEEFLLFAGYSGPNFSGVSPMETLRALLEENTQAIEFRSMMWKRQATHTGVVERAEKWDSPQSRQNFLEGLRAFDSASERSGGTMLLDEGMVWKDRKPSFKPKDLDDIEARKLTDIEVCSMFHVAPEMLGVRQGNYSNMEAFRQSLYRDNLGPYIDGWEQAMTPLVTILGEDNQYVEAFLDAKLRGSFEEQAKVFQTSVGAPIMTRNEARRKVNLPDVEDGDELITPLNVLVGGQASLTDSGTQNEKGTKSKSWKTASPALAEDWEPEAQSELSRVFTRQEKTVRSNLGAKSRSWWDEERWDKELTDALAGVAKRMSGQAGAVYASQLGFDPSLYNARRTYAYLETVAETRAKWINTKTLAALETAINEDIPISEVFEDVRIHRMAVIAAAFVAAVAGWVAEETGRQLMPGNGWKTWVVTSSNPRASHSAMNGETVPIGSKFSNGMNWPGDPVGGVDEVAGCMCGVEISREI